MNSMTISFSLLGILAIPLVLFAALVLVYTLVQKRFANVPFECGDQCTTKMHISLLQ